MTLSSKTPSVLIVDDDPGVRNVITRILNMNNYETTDVDNAEEALETVQTKSFDLIVCDVHMPGMNGLEFLEALKLIDPGIASVVITSSDGVDIAVKAMRSGALGFVPKPFTSTELLETIGTAMASARMVRETMGMKLYTPLLEKASAALLNALEAKDRDSQGHGQRVAKYAVEVASNPALGLSADEVSSVYFGALFHDIGKIAVSDRILHKITPLNEEEMAEMAKHPEVGARIIGRVKGLEGAAEIIRYHHEWWSGEGYPEKLAGEAIPLGARIVALVDAYEELTSKRTYSDGISHEEAIEIIKKAAGKQFDPNILTIFLQKWETPKNVESLKQ
jgi:putative two-component system response regulator